MNKIRRTFLAMAMAVACIATGPAAGLSAKPPGKSVADRARARGLFIKAKRDFALGRFQEALKGFSKAYGILPLPGLLFNIGQCQRMLNDCKKAIFLYEGYLSAKPGATNRQTVEDLIVQCKKKIKSQARTAPRPVVRPVVVRITPRVIPPKPFVPKVPTTREKKRPIYKKWWFWTAVGTGVVAAVATTLAVTLSSKTETVLPSGSLGTVDLRP